MVAKSIDYTRFFSTVNTSPLFNSPESAGDSAPPDWGRKPQVDIHIYVHIFGFILFDVIVIGDFLKFLFPIVIISVRKCNRFLRIDFVSQDIILIHGM